MLPDHHISAAASNAQAVTYGGTGAAVLFWGMHASDIAVMLSALASILGVILQFWLAVRRIRRLEHREETQDIVTTAIAKSHRVLDAKQKGKGSGDAAS